MEVFGGLDAVSLWIRAFDDDVEVQPAAVDTAALVDELAEHPRLVDWVTGRFPGRGGRGVCRRVVGGNAWSEHHHRDRILRDAGTGRLQTLELGVNGRAEIGARGERGYLARWCHDRR